jgi:type IV pilus assembly protein PilN
MIRINLLPTRKKKRKPLILPPPFLYGIGALVLVIIISLGMVIYMNGKVSDLKEDIAAKQKRMQELKVVLKKIEDLEKNNEEVKRKTRIIEQLKRNQIVPLVLLDEVSEVLPEGVWLTKLTDKNMAINIEGYAHSNTELVEYVQSLKALKYFQNVTLIESKQETFEGIIVYKFKLSFKEGQGD